MRHIFNGLAVAAGALFCAGIGGAYAAGAQPLAAAFGRLPGVETAEISPDGTHIAILNNSQVERFITLAPVDGGKSVTVTLGGTAVKDLRWAGNSYVLVRASALNTGRDENNGHAYAFHAERDLVIDLNGKMVTQLLNDKPGDASVLATGLPIWRVVDGPSPQAFVQGLDWSSAYFKPNLDSHLAKNEKDIEWVLWKVDVATGKSKLAERGTADTQEWRLDLQGGARVRIDYSVPSKTQYMLLRAKGANSWRRVSQAKDGQDVGLLSYSDPEDSVYLWRADADDGKGHVVRHSLTDDAETVVGPSSPAADAWVRSDPYTTAAVAIGVEREATQLEWLDPQLGAIHAKLSRVFKGKQVSLANWSKDRTKFIVEVEAADAAPTWFLFDAPHSQLSPVGEAYPELAGMALGKTSWFTYKARDGLEIPAYLTLPPNAATNGKLPLIVMPHGGPASRDHGDFDFWAQFLAVQGYVVLQPQFRGSSGFGAAFERAGEREWGGKMQTDLLDGIADLAAKGVIDPARVCIAGWSFGGYAALAGVSLHPEAYKCAVSINGVSDLPLVLFETQHETGDSAELVYWRRVIGDNRDEADKLRAWSPAHQAQAVQAPVLLVHAKEDTTVPYEQSESMAKALAKAGKPAEFVSLAGDDHSLSTAAARTRMLEATSAFLSKNLPVSAAQPASAATAATGS